MFSSADPILASAPALALRMREVMQIDAIMHVADEGTDPGRNRSAGRLLAGESRAATQPGHLGPDPGLADHESARPLEGGAARTVTNASGGRWPAPAGIVLPLSTGAEEHVSLGPLARVLASLAPQLGAAATAVPLASIDALVAEPARFATALAHTVRNSGVFYESHLRDWVEGRIPFEAIRAEPRAQTVGHLSAASPEPPTEKAAISAPARLAGSLIEAGNLLLKPEAVTVAQLRCAESNEMHFSIQIWPGQSAQMLLRVPERAARQGHAAPQEPVTPGAGVLKMHLPILGQLEARIQTSGAEVRVTLSTSDPAVARRLRGAAPSLTDGMTSASLNLISTSVYEQPD